MRSTRASASPPASTRSPPTTAAKKSPACWPAPRSPPKRERRRIGCSGPLGRRSASRTDVLPVFRWQDSLGNSPDLKDTGWSPATQQKVNIVKNRKRRGESRVVEAKNFLAEGCGVDRIDVLQHDRSVFRHVAGTRDGTCQEFRSCQCLVGGRRIQCHALCALADVEGNRVVKVSIDIWGRHHPFTDLERRR